MRLLRSCPILAIALLLAAPLGAQRTPLKVPPKAAPAKADTVKPQPASKPAQSEPPKFAYLQGVATDSVHAEPLAAALIQIEGTNRVGVTDALGRFLIDSIPPGEYRLVVDHPLLDTLGITLATPKMTFVVNEITRTTVAVPSAAYFSSLFCTPARRMLGPGALVGRVRDPDTDQPADSARVSLVYYDPDPPGLPANLKLKKQARVREARVGADGTYRLCGLPATFEGLLQAQRKDGGATAEVTITQSEGTLTLRSMSVSPLPKAIASGTDTVTKAVVPRGTARAFGKVLNANGAPVSGARVGLWGGSSSTRTRDNGDFVLDSLPAGTQALEVRQLGYRPTHVPVELSSRTPARVTVKLGIFIPQLSPVEVISRREEGLQKVGYLDRKRGASGGHFIDPETIEKRHAQFLSDLLRTVPGIRVQTTNGQTQLISTRTSTGGGGCVNIVVDGGQWQQLEAGDLDSFVRPEEVAAIEVYNGISTPPQFQQTGSNCAVVVVWTKTRVDSRRK